MTWRSEIHDAKYKNQYRPGKKIHVGPFENLILFWGGRIRTIWRISRLHFLYWSTPGSRLDIEEVCKQKRGQIDRFKIESPQQFRARKLPAIQNRKG